MLIKVSKAIRVVVERKRAVSLLFKLNLIGLIKNKCASSVPHSEASYLRRRRFGCASTLFVLKVITPY